MPRTRSSVIWDVSSSEFAGVVSQSSTLTAIAKRLNACPQAGTFKIIKTRLREENVDHSHISLGRDHAKGKRGGLPSVAIPLEQILVEGSAYSRASLKRRLLKAGLLENTCAICNLGPEWQQKPLSLRLDHENGIYNDNRLENLRLICPNCDSQLPTFCRGNVRSRGCKSRCSCGRRKDGNALRCRSCDSRSRIGNVRTKAVWPDEDELKRMLKVENKNQLARRLGISWNGLQHYLRRRGLA